MSERIVIIGAGPCGLGAAHRLAELGHADWLLVERAAQPGGLSASFAQDGFTWDLGGHVFFSHFPEFTRIVEESLDNQFLAHRRDASICMLGRFVPYPFQNNIHRLPPEVRDECLAGLRLAAANPDPRPANFSEWIDATFGPGIARHFARPYNAKVWNALLAEMDWRWVGDRVAVPDVRRIEENIRLNRDDDAWGPNNTFRFPTRGGTGAIWHAIARRLPQEKLLYNEDIAAIDLAAKTCTTASGRRIEYDRLISTMPLTEFARMAGLPVPPLRFTSTWVLGLGIEGEPPDALRTRCWMYFPERDDPFYRVTVFSNYSWHNAPRGTWSLLIEVQNGDPSAGERLWPDVIAALERGGLLPRGSRIAARWARFIPHSYPVPTLDRDRVLADALPHLKSAGVLSRGRFGAWKYEIGNMDHSFMQGVDAADLLLQS